MLEAITKAHPMTLEEIEQSDKTFLLAVEVSGILKADPNNIRVQAQQAPYKLGFPVIVAGHRVKIPRIPFLKFIKGEAIYITADTFYKPKEAWYHDRT